MNCVPEEIKDIEDLCEFRIEANCSGVYFLCDEKEVIYIGQSVSVLSRVGYHFRHTFFMDEVKSIYYLPMDVKWIDSFEEMMIDLIKPKHNKAWRSYQPRRPSKPKAPSQKKISRPKNERNLKYIEPMNGKPGYYMIDITLNHKRIRCNAGRTKKEAKLYLAQLRVNSMNERRG